MILQKSMGEGFPSSANVGGNVKRNITLKFCN